MTRRLLCMDMDGTLLDDRGGLGAATAEALRALRRAGHVVSFVTGRSEVDMRGSEHLYGHADFILLNTGAKLVDLSTGAVLFCQRVDDHSAAVLVGHCLDRRIPLYVMMGRRYAVTTLHDGVEDYAREVGLRPQILTGAEDLPAGAVESFMSTREGDAVVDFIRRRGLPLRWVGSEPGCYDIMPEAVGKWPGVRRLAGLLGIPEDHVVAAGNYDNDVDMLRGAGVGVAVANARSCVKAAADYVTARSNNQDAAVEIARVFFGL